MENSRGAKSKSSSASRLRKRDEGELAPRTLVIANEFNSGDNFEELMERHQVTRGTILEHLTKFVMAGNELRVDHDLPSMTAATLSQQQAAFAAFDELGPALLKPVFDKINGQLNYEELKILRLSYLIAKQE